MKMAKRICLLAHFFCCGFGEHCIIGIVLIGSIGSAGLLCLENPTECVVDLVDHSSGTQTVADSNLNTSTTSLTLSGMTISAEKSLSLHVIPEASSSDSSTQQPLVAKGLQETLESDSSSQPPVLPEQQDSTPTPFVDDPSVPTELQEIKWYFNKSATLAYPEDEASYNCTTKFHPHFSANASKRFRSWKACVEDLDAGAYDIILEVSTSKLILDYIEFITFTIHRNMNSTYTDLYDFNDRVNERIPNAGLRKLCERSPNNPNGRCRWKFHRQFVKDHNPYVTMSMEIRLSINAPLNVDHGHFDLHSLTFSSYQNESVSQSLKTQSYQPFLWSVSVGTYPSRMVEPSIRQRYAQVVMYGISGNGMHLATVSRFDSTVVIEVWMLPSSASESSSLSVTSIGSPNYCAYLELSSSNKAWSLSISWDASQIAVVPEEVDNDLARDTGGTMVLLHYKARQNADGIPSGELTRQKIHSKLENFISSGKFHFTSAPVQGPQDELYIACGLNGVDVYTVFGEWMHVRSISLTLRDLDWIDRRKVIQSAGGQHFVVDTDDEVTVWDITTGAIVVSLQLQNRGRELQLSSDGGVLVSYDDHLAIHLLQTGTALATSNTLPGGTLPKLRTLGSIATRREHQSDIVFGRGSVATIHGDLIKDFKVIDRILWCPLFFLDPRDSQYDSESSRFFCASGSRLDYGRAKDFKIDGPVPLLELPACDCTANTASLSTFAASRQSFISSAGVTFTAALVPIRHYGLQTDQVEVSALATGIHEQPVVVLTLPPTRCNQGYRQTCFHADLPLLFAFASHSVTVWKVPVNLNDSFQLLLCNYSIYGLKFGQCIHMQPHALLGDAQRNYSQLVRLSVMDASPPDYTQLDELFQIADMVLRKIIISYVILLLKGLGVSQERVVYRFHLLRFKAVKEQGRDLLDEVLSSPDCRWIPMPDVHHTGDTFALSLTNPAFLPLLMEQARVLVDYCFRKARAEQDLFFLERTMKMFPQLLSDKHRHSQLTKNVLRRMAFLPVHARTRNTLVVHHQIAHPPELRLRFWKPNQRLLYQCKNPVLHLSSDVKSLDTTTRFFGDLFVAPVDMLSKLYNTPQEIQADKAAAAATAATAGTPPRHWIFAFILAIRSKFELPKLLRVRCHDFTLDHYDNPAIEAIIEYKWNTIGFYLWISRFLWQCIYYLMILVAMFIQVYDPEQPRLHELFVTITVASSVFLILELIQFFEDRDRYFSTLLYNMVDIAAFSVPLAGSVNQLLMSAQNDPETTPQGPHYWIFSISAIVIFFHLFFELRVNEWVCKFETIIVRILNSIRVFFFIFAAGLLAFTIAFLHLLQGCVQAPCLVPPTLFPRHFYRAFSAVYFFMGGRYDPVGQEMDSENWVFLTLMLFFFLFTVILMLNVLIALLNVAFSQGDETWRLVWLANRLRYCESAETLSWRIPGFRQWYGYFPKYIYYTASPQQVKAFWDRHLGLLEPADQKAVDEKASAKPNADETITYNALYGVEKEQSVSSSTNNAAASTGSRATSPSVVERILQEFKEQMLLQSQEANQRLMQEFKDQLISETRRALQESKSRN